MRKLTGAEARSGYVKEFGFNKDWKKQKAICGYEHCIELMDLPPIPRKEAIEHNNYLKECLKTKVLGDGRPLDKAREKWFKQQVKDFRPETYSIKTDRGKSCLIFGHNCPGGKEMKEKCKVNKVPEERFYKGGKS